MNTAVFPPGTFERMKVLLGEAKKASELKRIQCVLLGSQKISSPQIAPLVGLNSVNIRRIWDRYRAEGESALLRERRGGSRGSAHLTLEEEAEFLKSFLEKSKQGGILIVSEIHEAYEAHVGEEIHLSLIYRLLHRHGWRKIAPRPHHPKRNVEKQEEWRGSFPPPDRKGKGSLPHLWEAPTGYVSR
jgi:transposase